MRKKGGWSAGKVVFISKNLCPGSSRISRQDPVPRSYCGGSPSFTATPGSTTRPIEVLKELQRQMPRPTAKVAVLLAQCLKAKGDPQAALTELQNLLATAAVPGAVFASKAVLKQELGLAEEAAGDIEEAVLGTKAAGTVTITNVAQGCHCDF